MDKQTFQALIDVLSLPHLFFAVATVVGAWLSVKLFNTLIVRLARRFNRYRLQITGFQPVVDFVVWVGAIGFIIFGILRPPDNVVIAVSASIGIAAGLAAQDVLRNALAGVLMLINRPFQVGDMIEIDNHYGEVVNVGIQNTRLHTFDDSIVTIPNSRIMTQAVVNANAGELDELVTFAFALPAHVDVYMVKNLAWEAALCSPYAYLKKPIVINVEDAAELMLLTRFRVKVYVVDIRLERLVATDIMMRIKSALRERGIVVAGG